MWALEKAGSRLRFSGNLSLQMAVHTPDHQMRIKGPANWLVGVLTLNLVLSLSQWSSVLGKVPQPPLEFRLVPPEVSCWNCYQHAAKRKLQHLLIQPSWQMKSKTWTPAQSPQNPVTGLRFQNTAQGKATDASLQQETRTPGAQTTPSAQT